MASPAHEIGVQLAIVAAAAAAASAAAWLAPKLRWRLEGRRAEVGAALALGAAAAAFGAAFAYLANVKFDTLSVPAIDFGIQHHVYWWGARGGFLRQTVIHAKPHLNHVALLAQLLAKLSAVFPSPRALLIIQSVALASSALPAYLLARRRTPSRFLAFAFGLSLLLLVPFQANALYDFHGRTFVPAFVLWAFWFLESNRLRPALLFFFLTVLVIETMAIYVCAAGLFIALALKKRAAGFTVAVVAALYFAAATYIVYPQLVEIGGGMQNPIWAIFGAGYTPWQVAVYAVTKPALFFGRALDVARGAYLVKMAAPWAFLSAGAGWGWLAFALPLVNTLFGRYPPLYDVNFQYALPFAAFLFYFATRAWGAAERRLAARPVAAGWARRTLASYLVLAGVGAAAAFGPLGAAYRPEWYNVKPYAANFDAVAARVSPERSLAATMFELPHFTTRRRAYLFPEQFTRFDDLLPYEVLVRTADCDEKWTAPTTEEWYAGPDRLMLTRLLRHRRYGCVYADGKYILLRRGARGLIPAADAFARQYQLVEDDALMCDVGYRIADGRACDGRAIYTPEARGPLGVAARTPPRYWPGGIIEVRYRLALASPSRPFAPVAELVVASRDEDGRREPVAVRTLATADFPRRFGYVWRSVAFECRAARRYEFYLYGLGNGDLYLDRLFVAGAEFSLARAFNPPASRAEWEAAAARARAFSARLSPAPAGYELR